MSELDKVNILLVDDQPGKLLSHEVVLQGLGENLIKATSANEALACLLKTDVAVILVDVCMPDLDGFQLVKLLREHPRFERTAVIFISGVAIAELDFVRGYESGAVDYVSVPVVPEVLRAKVKVFVDLYRKTRALQRLNDDLEARVRERTSELEAATQRLRESEEHHRFVLQSLPAAVYSCDREGRITLFNQAAAELWGRKPELGRDHWSSPWKSFRRSGKPFAAQDCPVAIALKTGEAVPRLELQVERDDGTRRAIMPFPIPIKDNSGAITGALELLMDVTERNEAEERRRILMAELDHRVKNMLANIYAMVRVSGKGASSLESYVTSLGARIQAMARAHDLLRRTGWSVADFGDIVQESLSPFQTTALNLRCEGPTVQLSARQAQAIALAFHELATNAMKYGAWSMPGGIVELKWRVEAAPGRNTLALCWEEAGGPPCTTPTRVGFGTTILNLAASDVMGTSRSSFEPRGFAWQLSFDLEQMPSTAEPERADSTAQRRDQGPAKVADASFVVLVVEDEPLIALQVQADLENDGHKVIGPALTLEHGLQLAETEKLDMALLDVNLRGRTSEGIAEVLMRRQIPFAFASGYSDNALLGDKWRAAPRLKKPFDQLRLRRQLAELSAAPRSS